MNWVKQEHFTASASLHGVIFSSTRSYVILLVEMRSYTILLLDIFFRVLLLLIIHGMELEIQGESFYLDSVSIMSANSVASVVVYSSEDVVMYNVFCGCLIFNAFTIFFLSLQMVCLKFLSHIGTLICYNAMLQLLVVFFYSL